MYEPFPGNYVWNLSINIALHGGANMGELDRAIRPLREAASRGEDAGTALFFDSLVKVAHQLRANGEADETKHRKLSASRKYRRASTYLQTAERMQARDYVPRKEAYNLSLELFRRSLELAGERTEFLDIPFEDSKFQALFVPSPTAEQRGPCLISVNGLDSMKEQVYNADIARGFLARGTSLLIVDQPGTGSALRHNNLHVIYDSERWASACVNYLETRPDVDPKRIGIFGLSFGGYHAPRAAAFEKRLALCAVQGANHNWGDLQRRRLAREGENPVPHYWDHVMWVWGKPDMASFMEEMPRVTLNGVVEKITVPFLVTHFTGDRQIPVVDALQSFDLATASPKRELRIFTESDFEVEHCGADNGSIAPDFIADWVAETFAEMKT